MVGRLVYESGATNHDRNTKSVAGRGGWVYKRSRDELNESEDSRNITTLILAGDRVTRPNGGVGLFHPLANASGSFEELLARKRCQRRESGAQEGARRERTFLAAYFLMKLGCSDSSGFTARCRGFSIRA